MGGKKESKNRKEVSSYCAENISLPGLQDVFLRGLVDKQWMRPLILPNHHLAIWHMHLKMHCFYGYLILELNIVAAKLN